MAVSDLEWCLKKLTELNINDNKIDILTQIRNQLFSPLLIHCLKIDTSPELRQLANEILSMCLSNLDINNKDTTAILIDLLKHNNYHIRASVLNELVKIYKRNPDIKCIDIELTILIITCLDAIETEVAVPAITILSQILINGYEHELIQSNFTSRLVKEPLIRLRIYEICINLAKTSPAMLYKMSYILGHLLNEFNRPNDYILLQLNILELLVSLAEQNHGLIYLENQNVFQKICKNLEKCHRNPLDQLLIPGYMKFFGKIAFNQPQRIIENYPNMIICLFDCLVSQDMTVLPTAFDTLANIAHSNDGKILLDQQFAERMKESFEEFASYLRNLPTNMKNRAFNALEEIFRCNGGVSTEIIENITYKWCQYLKISNDFKMFIDFCKNPIPDIKVSCLSLIKTLCTYKWAQECIQKTGGFIEYLLDRRVEFDKEARFMKYEIIDLLSKSSIFDGPTIVLLKKFVNEGPYYVEGIVEVAVEGGL